MWKVGSYCRSPGAGGVKNWGNDVTDPSSRPSSSTDVLGDLGQTARPPPPSLGYLLCATEMTEVPVSWDYCKG